MYVAHGSRFVIHSLPESNLHLKDKRFKGNSAEHQE